MVFTFISIKKIDSTPFKLAAQELPNIYFLKDADRVKVSWGGFSVVEATLTMLSLAFSSDWKYDRCCLLSGADFPIKPMGYIEERFRSSVEFIRIDRVLRKAGSDNHAKRFRFRYFPDSRIIAKKPDLLLKLKLRRFAFPEIQQFQGSQWWSLTRCAVDYILSFIQNSPAYVRFHRGTLVSDEIFFHSIIGNAPESFNVSQDYRNAPCLESFFRRNEHGCHYLDWNAVGEVCPKTLRDNDFSTLIGSDMLFARKFMENVSDSLVERLKTVL